MEKLSRRERRDIQESRMTWLDKERRSNRHFAYLLGTAIAAFCIYDTIRMIGERNRASEAATQPVARHVAYQGISSNGISDVYTDGIRDEE